MGAGRIGVSLQIVGPIVGPFPHAAPPIPALPAPMAPPFLVVLELLEVLSGAVDHFLRIEGGAGGGRMVLIIMSAT